MPDILQTVCKECSHEVYHKHNDDDYIYCPECGAKLNEYSSGDTSEGDTSAWNQNNPT